MCGNNITCGVFSLCDPQAIDPCHCLKGFEPVDGSLRYDEFTQNKGKGRRYAGCVRKSELLCQNISSNSSNDRFLRFDKMELPPDEMRLKMDSTERCESTCVKNCSCIAYAYYFNSYCMLWYNNILSLKNISSDIENGNNNHPAFYLRLAASEFVTTCKLKEPLLFPLFPFLSHLNENQYIFNLVSFVNYHSSINST
jgi:hypothetical protein